MDERRGRVRSVLLPRRSRAAGAQSPADRPVASRAQRTAAATKVLTRPKWLLFHVAVAAVVVTFVLLGRWQLSVSSSRHFDFFNFQYALQWWIFAACVIYGWIRVMQYRFNPPALAPTSGSGLVVASKGAVVLSQGATTLIAPGSTDADAPVVYRGYVIPESSRVPVRSHGDPMHDAYNDYLWQLAAADGETPDVQPRSPAPTDRLDGVEIDPGPAARELD